MKRVFLTLSALAVFLTGCGSEQVSEGTVALELTGEVIDIGETSYFLGETISYENVSVVPLIAQDYDPEQEVDYITLAEAAKNDWIEIIEKPGSATVSELTVRYTGPKSLLLLAGELLLGGKQDRIVAKDTVIEPKSTVVVSVFCVEPGRWSGTSLSFDYADAQVPISVKEQAMLGDQSGVWGATRSYNQGVGADGGRSTVDMGMKSGEVVKFTKAGKERLLALRDTDRPVVGVVFIINGKIRSLEIFGAPRLFSSAYESILGGVLAEAAIDRSDDFELPSAETLQAFLANASSAQAAAILLTGAPSSAGLYMMDAENGVIGGAVLLDEEGGGSITHGTFYNKED